VLKVNLLNFTKENPSNEDPRNSTRQLSGQDHKETKHHHEDRCSLATECAAQRTHQNQCHSKKHSEQDEYHHQQESIETRTAVAIPTAPGKEQDMEIVSVGPQDIKMKSNDPKKPGEFTVTKKELDPVISNVLQRSRGQAQR
jgi:hypothetical protein